MKLGIKLPTIGAKFTPHDILAISEEADRLGYYSLSVGDHVVRPYQVESLRPSAFGQASVVKPNENYLDPFIALSYVAGRTERVKLVVAVCVVPYRYPLVTAKMVSTLDFLSAGRVVLGVGVGWLAEEFAALGVPFEDRGSRTDEYVRVFKALWKGHCADFQGQFVQFHDVGCFPTPVQQPGPPVWVGGHSDRALRRTVELGDGWTASGLSPKDMEVKLATIGSLCKRYGRELSTLQLSVGVDTSAAAPGSADFRVKYTTDWKAPSLSTPLRTALRQFAGIGVELVILRFPEDELVADRSLLERAMSCAGL